MSKYFPSFVFTSFLLLGGPGVGGQERAGIAGIEGPDVSAAPSPAAQEAVLLMRDLLLHADRFNLTGDQKQKIQSIRPDTVELRELAGQFENLYCSDDCKTAGTCLSEDIIAAFRRAWNSGKERGISDQNVSLDLRLQSPNDRRTAAFGLKLLEDISHEDPAVKAGFPWCIFTGSCSGNC